MKRAAACALFGWALACGDNVDHPPPPPECDPTVTSCRPLSPVQRPPPSSGTGGGNGGPANGGSDAGGAAATELGGSVLLLDQSLFQGGLPFVDGATIEAEGVESPLVSAAWDGVTPFVISGYEPSAETWFSVRPDIEGSGALRALHPIDTRSDRIEDLELVPALDFDLVFQLLTVPDERRPGRGHVILRFVDAGIGEGVAGIGVSMPEASFVAFATGGSFSDTESVTDGTGVVVLGNVSAPQFPGSTERITLSEGASGFVELRVAAEAVTLVQVPLAAP